MWATPTMKSISIHALREEGDDHGFEIQPEAAIFLSTPSARRATPHRLGVVQGQPISIHALREEGDLELYGVPAANIRFLSTPSARRATIQAALLLCADEDFYPRPPRGGRQPFLAHQRCGPNISIHALREEGDPPSRRRPCRRKRFLSTPSARRATCFPPRPRRWGEFLSTPSARRATGRSAGCPRHTADFYPRPPRGGRRNKAPQFVNTKKFLSTPSARRATLEEVRNEQKGEYFYPRPPRGGRPAGQHYLHGIL